jgi:hypothetical protein
MWCKPIEPPTLWHRRLRSTILLAVWLPVAHGEVDSTSQQDQLGRATELWAQHGATNYTYDIVKAGCVDLRQSMSRSGMANALTRAHGGTSIDWGTAATIELSRNYCQKYVAKWMQTGPAWRFGSINSTAFPATSR